MNPASPGTNRAAQLTDRIGADDPDFHPTDFGDADFDDADFDVSLFTLSPRPDPRRSDVEIYPRRYVSRIRFSDIDTLGHLNNVAHDSFHEDGRTMLCARVFPLDQRIPGVRQLAAQNTLHFLAEAFYPGQLLICAGVGRIGTTSFVTSTALFQEGVCVSLCDTVMVYEVGGRPAALPDVARVRLRGYHVAARSGGTDRG
jgi:acyl-CoA thioester hydrolase